MNLTFGAKSRAVFAVLALGIFCSPLIAQEPPPRPYVAWPDHNYAVVDPGTFDPDVICGAGQTPLADFCWETLGSGDVPIFDPLSDANPNGTDISSGEVDGTYPSLYYSFDDLSEYPQAIQDKLPGGVMFIRMRLRDSPLSNNVDNLKPYASSAAWHFLFDIGGDGYTDFIARTYGVNDLIQIFFNDYDFLHVTPSTAELDTSCGPSGVRLWNEPTELVTFAQDTGNINVPTPLGCSSGPSDPYCNFGYTRIVYWDATNPGGNVGQRREQGAYLDMQFPMYAFRSCRTGDEFVPPGGGQAVRGDLAFQNDQPFMVCASTGTQSNNLFAKDFAITSPAGYSPAVENTTACSDPCTLEGGCDTGLLLIDAAAACGLGTNSSPVTLTAEVMATNELIADEVVTSVEEITFQYWQVGVDTQWQNIGTLTEPTSGLNVWEMDFVTENMDISDNPVFQFRVIGFDKFGKQLAETFVELDLQVCDVTGTPVTLAHFVSDQSGNQLEVEWATSSEIANTGFNLYGQSANGRWYQLNDELIESSVVDSVQPQEYDFTAQRGDIRMLMLEDVDIRGIPKLHGPFNVGEGRGRQPDVEAIDWDVVAREDRANAQRRGQSWRQQNHDPVRLLVDQDGIYRVTFEDLLAEGLDLDGVPVRHIAVTNMGDPVAFHTEAKGRFGPGDFIEFYGTGVDTLYTDHDVYMIHVDNRNSLRMKEENAGAPPGKGSRPGQGGEFAPHYLQTVSVWRDQVYSFSSRSQSPWFDSRLRARRNRPQEWNFDFEVEGLIPGEPGELFIQYWGMTSDKSVTPDHRLVIELNGSELLDDAFNGPVLRQHSIQVPADMLVDGSNQVTLTMPGDTGAIADIIGFDGFRVQYPRQFQAIDGSLHFSAEAERFQVGGLQSDEPLVYRIEDDEVVRFRRPDVEGNGPYEVTFSGSDQAATYVVTDSERLLTPKIEPGRAERDITSGQADYLMVAHPNFIDGLEPLVDFHESQGRSVRVVDVMDIYDQFNGGVVSANAIRAYIRATATHMGYEHVLLVGGDTYDYKDVLGTGSISFIPSLYAETGPFVTFAPVDALFVDINGNGVPDLPIGRLPVRTEAELAEIIGKTIEYASRDYRGKAVFAADREETGMSFTQSSQQLMGSFLADWTVDRAYVDWMPVPDARNRLLGSINQGSSLTSFIGHSSFSVWTFDGLFSSADVADLENHGRPTAVVQYGCWNTYHVIPSYNTLGHSFMLSEDRGAALVVGSSTWTSADAGDSLGQRFMPLLSDGSLTVGKALTEAKQDLATSRPEMKGAILGWSILGDPAIRIGD